MVELSLWINAWGMVFATLVFTVVTAISVYAFVRQPEPIGNEVARAGKWMWWYGAFATLCSISWVGLMFIKSMYKVAIS